MMKWMEASTCWSCVNCSDWKLTMLGEGCRWRSWIIFFIIVIITLFFSVKQSPLALVVDMMTKRFRLFLQRKSVLRYLRHNFTRELLPLRFGQVSPVRQRLFGPSEPREALCVRHSWAIGDEEINQLRNLCLQNGTTRHHSHARHCQERHGFVHRHLPCKQMRWRLLQKRGKRYCGGQVSSARYQRPRCLYRRTASGQ